MKIRSKKQRKIVFYILTPYLLFAFSNVLTRSTACTMTIHLLVFTIVAQIKHLIIIIHPLLMVLSTQKLSPNSSNDSFIDVEIKGVNDH